MAYAQRALDLRLALKNEDITWSRGQCLQILNYEMDTGYLPGMALLEHLPFQARPVLQQLRLRTNYSKSAQRF